MAGIVFTPASSPDLGQSKCCLKSYRGLSQTPSVHKQSVEFSRWSLVDICCPWKTGMVSRFRGLHEGVSRSTALFSKTRYNEYSRMRNRLHRYSGRASLDVVDVSDEPLQDKRELAGDQNSNLFSEDFEVEDKEEDEEEDNRKGGESEYFSDDERMLVDVQEEALELLEWPAFCRQLMHFTATPVGTRRASRAQLQFGETIHVSDKLLNQTEAALALDKPLDFSGVENVSETLCKAANKSACSVQELWNIATTLKAAARLYTQLDVRPLLPSNSNNDIQDSDGNSGLKLSEVVQSPGKNDGVSKPLQGGERSNKSLLSLSCNVNDGTSSLAIDSSESKAENGGSFAGREGEEVRIKKQQGPLQDILQGANFCLDLLANLEHCLDGPLQKVLDRASEKLSDIRNRRAANSKELQGMLTETVRKLYASGASDGPLVVLRRSRYCVGVRAGFKNMLPGGITLDVSNSGATLFIEPGPAIRLNNAEAELASQEAEEVATVLALLASQVASYDLELRDLLERVTTLDLAAARAAHADWLGGVRPKLVGESATSPHSKEGGGVEEEVTGGDPDLRNTDALWKVHICEVRHPLLLGPALPPPEEKKRESANVFSRAWQGTEISVLDAHRQLKASNEDLKPVLPVPIDIKIAPHVNVVAITGPNTGGKTAALKTLGTAALMAKAGFYIPAQGEVVLPWFDYVLADIGDEQSLEQNLSTFSGHIHRLARILKKVTTSSLVLLDEVGSGTDPSEGASLAKAVLHHLAETANLTVATTHYAELKLLKASDRRMENASVEFDTQTLRPTYRVLWGLAGQSNAFAIADSLNLDSAVLARARKLGDELSPSQAGVRANDLIDPLLSQKIVQQKRAAVARSAKETAERLYSEIKMESEDLQNRERLLLRQQEQELSLTVSTAQRRIAAEVVRIKKFITRDTSPVPNGSGSATSEETENPNLRVQGEPEDIDTVFQSVKAEVAAIVDELTVSPAQLTAMGANNGSFGEMTPEGVAGKGEWVPSVGDKVVVRRLGMSPVIVVESSESGEELAVQLGMMRMTVKVKEVLPAAVANLTEVNVEDKLVAVQKSMRAWQAKVNNARNEEAQKGADGSSPIYEARVQTSANTVDLRGMRVDEAVRELDLALAIRPAGSVVFIVHGIGTGAVKQAVIDLLQKHRAVDKFEPESRTNLGCTVAFIN